MSRYLGIDYGEKRIGLAISDPTLTIAQAYKTIHFASKKNLMQQISSIVKELEIEKIVLGLLLRVHPCSGIHPPIEDRSSHSWG